MTWIGRLLPSHVCQIQNTRQLLTVFEKTSAWINSICHDFGFSIRNTDQMQSLIITQYGVYIHPRPSVVVSGILWGFSVDGLLLTIKSSWGDRIDSVYNLSSKLLSLSSNRVSCRTPDLSPNHLWMLALFVDCLILSVIIRRIINTTKKNGGGNGIVPSF